MRADNMTNPKERHAMKPVQYPNVFDSNDNQGFTLIEALIALMVFSVGVLAVMTMTINANNGFSKSRRNNLEVNRTTLNLETLKEVGYDNDTVFQGTQVSPAGTDGASVGYEDTNDAVVAETKLIVIGNNKMKSGGTAGIYQICFTKPLIEN
jgi:prepilin-type N-terminal cleavage/methylation domain-containing protein